MSELFFVYYWHATRYNLVVSFLIAVLSLNLVNGVLCFGTFGIVASFLGYRYFQNLQYLLYLNAGYSKKKLMLTTALINISIALVIFLLILVF